MDRLDRDLRNQSGFTLVEVLVSMTLLLVGLAGTVTMVNVANGRTAVTQGREAGTNLVREVIEKAGAAPYDSLLTGAVTTELQKPAYGLGSLSAVTRRGRTYAVTVTGCTIDDRVDGYGSHAAGGYCSDSASTGAGDTNPDDYRRVTVTATWTRDGKSYSVTQSTAFVNPGNAAGPSVTSLGTTANFGTPAIVTTSPSTIQFQAVASSAATKVAFSIDGEFKAEVNGSGTFTWTWTNVTAASDATYLISAQATDAQGRTGQARTFSIQLNRRPPTAPTLLEGGRNLRLGTPLGMSLGSGTSSIVDLEWNKSVDRDVFGYRVYRSTSSSMTGAVKICDTTSASSTTDDFSCSDVGAPTNGTLYYGITALDRDPVTNAARETAFADMRSLTMASDNRRPNAPPSLTATRLADGTVQLGWAAGSKGHPQNEAVDFYRIYRSSNAADTTAYIDNRLDRTGDFSELTWIDTERVAGDAARRYWVTTVDLLFGESDPIAVNG